MKLMTVTKAVLLMGLGGASALLGSMITVDRPCPSMLAVSELVDSCLDGNRRACAQLDRTVPASCLMERAFEATEVRRQLHGEPEEIVL
ncbi:MAG TPA: hypothetical protein VGD45_20505 [Steroidobacter sp.]|uniref:hypothetical protein n=1 Tax=Steroidobacter sp. TaxID=1978227 RepID=UPI002EDA16E8